MNDKEAIGSALTERAERLWGPERAAKARANIEEAAQYIWLIGGHRLTNDDAPLFHPPVSPSMSPPADPPDPQASDD